MDIVIEEELEVNFQIRWNSKDYEMALPVESTVRDLKMKLFDETNVPIERQKLLGLKGPDGKLAGEDLILLSLKLKPTTKVMMMGTPIIEEEENLSSDLSSQNIVDDIGKPSSSSSPLANESIATRPENIEKIMRRIETYKFKNLNSPRKGKKLLVLDIDYTLFDHRSTVERTTDLMRPHLHEFLSSAYLNYDIFIWSATSLYVTLTDI